MTASEQGSFSALYLQVIEENSSQYSKKNESVHIKLANVPKAPLSVAVQFVSSGKYDNGAIKFYFPFCKDVRVSTFYKRAYELRTKKLNIIDLK